jgi:hypothetical protein
LAVGFPLGLNILTQREEKPFYRVGADVTILHRILENGTEQDEVLIDCLWLDRRQIIVLYYLSETLKFSRGTLFIVGWHPKHGFPALDGILPAIPVYRLIANDLSQDAKNA